MFSYTKIATIALVIVLGVPAVSLAGSFTTSLIQGKSPSEAVQVLSEQIDMLFGRIDSLETNQVVVDAELEKLRLENENLKLKIDSKADVVKPPVESTECIAIKNELETSREPYSQQISVLDEELSALYKERSNIRSGASTFKSDKEDEIERFQEELQKVREQDDEVKEKIEVIEDKIDVLQEKIKEVVAPIIKKAEQNNCLLG